MMRTSLILAALASAIPAGLAPAPSWGANLSEVYQLARDNDAQLAAAREARKAGAERAVQGKAGLLPTVSLGASARRVDPDSSSPTANNDPYNTRGFSLSLVQPIYRKQNLESYEQGKLQSLLSEQELKLAEQKLVLRVALAYFDVLMAQDSLATAQAQKQAFAEQLAQARKSFEVGAATITDTHEAQARFDLTSAQEIAAQNDLDVRRRALEKIINQEAPRLAELRDTAKLLLPQPANMDDWVKQAEADSLNVALNQTALEIARREVERQRGGHLPTLDLAASYTDNRNTQVSGLSSGINSKSAVLGLELGWSLYQGGAVDSRIREAVANQEKSRFNLDEARRLSRLEARQGYLGVLSGDAQVRALEQALVSSEAQLKSTKLGLEVGVRTRVDVLNAQQQVFSTRRDLAAAKYRTLLAGLELKAAAGTLGPDDLKALDALLKD